ncbi:hypothetical protein [Haloplanus halophilus]|uniref:hypothetical protein n=1 Tax=Haloplanus halophilus TaxID=2949993 RepID=UPI00203C00D0|nr:hypothetical protein [Haloplanus sp. GDY1]
MPSRRPFVVGHGSVVDTAGLLAVALYSAAGSRILLVTDGVEYSSRRVEIYRRVESRP